MASPSSSARGSARIEIAIDLAKPNVGVERLL